MLAIVACAAGLPADEPEAGRGIRESQVAPRVARLPALPPLRQIVPQCGLIEPRKFTLKQFEREVKVLIDDRPPSEVRKVVVEKAGRFDLAGNWRMLLPAGFEHRVTLKEVGENRYRLEPAGLNSSGVYELRDHRLVLVEPREERLRGFEWQVRSPYLATLVEQASGTGSDYLGAVLFRIK